MRIVDHLDKGASLGPGRPSLTTDGQTLTYGEVQQLTRRIAAALVGSGVAPGDKVAVLSANDPVAFATVLGVSRAGAVWCPVNPRNEAALTSRGDLYRSLGQIEPALVDLNTALSISPGCVRALAVRAATLRLAGDVKGAAADLEQALRLDRHHTRARLEVMRLPARYRKRLWRLGAS